MYFKKSTLKHAVTTFTERVHNAMQCCAVTTFTTCFLSQTCGGGGGGGGGGGWGGGGVSCYAHFPHQALSSTQARP